MNEFVKLAFNPACRMNEVYRYSGTYQNDQESLAEHITDVSMMAYIIANHLNQYSENVDVGLLLQKCLIHDLDETITGDVTRNTKYATPEVHNDLDEVADSAAMMISKYIDVKDMYDTWTTAKNDTKEGFILKVVDMLCVVKKAITEITLRHNLTFLKVINELTDHLEYLRSSCQYDVFDNQTSRDYLNDLIVGACEEVHSINSKYSYDIEKFNIIENVLGGTEYAKR